MEEILFKQMSYCVRCSEGLKKFCDLFLSLWMMYKEKLCELEIDLVGLLHTGLAVGALLGVFMILFRVRETLEKLALQGKCDLLCIERHSMQAVGSILQNCLDPCIYWLDLRGTWDHRTNHKN